MQIHIADQVEPAVLKMQGMLQKIDRLHLPATSRRDLESILVRQVSTDLDRLLPWQQDMDKRRRPSPFGSGMLRISITKFSPTEAGCFASRHRHPHAPTPFANRTKLA